MVFNSDVQAYEDVCDSNSVEQFSYVWKVSISEQC